MAFRLSPHLTVMANAAQKAAKRLLRDFAEVEQLQVSIKGPSDFVSQADIRAEQTLKEELTKARPGYGFLTARKAASPKAPTTGPTRWIVDPLDGTTNFLHGDPPLRGQHRPEAPAARHASTEIQAGLTYNPATRSMRSSGPSGARAPSSTTSRIRVAART